MKNAIKKWYVGDKFDNFGWYDTAAEAGVAADHLAADGIVGVHILHLTDQQFRELSVLGMHKWSLDNAEI